MDSLIKSINSVLIVGGGWVGRQLAARFAQYGLDVWLVDRDRDTVGDAAAWIEQLPDRAGCSPAEAADWRLRVHPGPGLNELARDPAQVERLAVEASIGLIVESVPEQLSLKKRVLRQVSQLFPSPVIIASNSSYFVPSLLAPFVEGPERYAHFHFHVPVLNDSVVDIVGCDLTAPETLESLRLLSLRIGQEPLMLRHEHPGYVFNWMLQSLLKSALELAALDVADPTDIDKSWRAVTGMALGPFGMMDQIGLDVVEQVLANARWSDPIQVKSEMLLRLLQEKTQAGHLGVKTQRGFYTYQHPAISQPESR